MKSGHHAHVDRFEKQRPRSFLINITVDKFAMDPNGTRKCHSKNLHIPLAVVCINLSPRIENLRSSV